MSWPCIQYALKFPGLSPAERTILVFLADHANAQGLAWPSARLLASRSGLSRSQVNRTLAVLTDKKAVEKIGKKWKLPCASMRQADAPMRKDRRTHASFYEGESVMESIKESGVSLEKAEITESQKAAIRRVFPRTATRILGEKP